MKVNSSVELAIKVTTIDGIYHARLTKDGQVIDEMACKEKSDIGYICREMLRWFSKLGGVSKWAEASRKRQNEEKGPEGKIWYLK